MERKEIISVIKKEKVVAILRAKAQKDVESIVEAVFSTGLSVLEITSNTPGYLEEISKARKVYPNKLIGAGTVINLKIASEVIKAGAQFIVTPNTNADVIKFAHEYDVPVLVGALTPTEVCVAAENGADVIKLFPAGNLDTPYLKAVQGPLDNLEYFAVGGINTENVDKWFKSGASGVGYGCVVNNPKTGSVDLDAVKNTAQKFLDAAKNN